MPPDGAQVAHLLGAVKVQNSKNHSIKPCFQLQEICFNERDYEVLTEKCVHFVHFQENPAAFVFLASSQPVLLAHAHFLSPPCHILKLSVAASTHSSSEENGAAQRLEGAGREGWWVTTGS